MAGGSEVKSVLTLDVSKFTSAIDKATANLETLDKQLKSVGKVSVDFEKSVSGLSAGILNVSDKFKMLDKTVDSLVGKLGQAIASGFDTVSKKSREASKDVEGFGKAVKQTTSINADQWIKKYAEEINKLAPAIKSAISSIVEFDRANTTSGNVSEASAAKTISAKLRILESEKQTNSKIIADREKMAAEVRAIQSKLEAEATAKRLDASLYFGKNAPKGNALRSEASSLDGMAAQIGQEIQQLEILIKELKWKNAEIDKGIQLVREQATADEKAAIAAKEKADAEKIAATAAKEAARASKLASDESARAARAAAAERIRAAREAADFERQQAQQIATMWKGMVQLWGASRIERGLGSSIISADQMQRAEVIVKSLNYSSEHNKAIMDSAFDMSNGLKFISVLDSVKSRMSAIASIGYDNAEIIDKTLSSAVKAANNLRFLGIAEHGDMQTTIRNLYGVVEMRQQTADPEATNRTFELMQKIITGTQGKVETQDMETVLRRLGMGAGQLSDHGMLNLAAVVDQFKVAGGGGDGGGASGGVSTVGTAFKMMQAYAIGKAKTAQAVNEFVGAGVLDTGGLDLTKDNAHILREAKGAGFKDAKLWMEDPVAAVQKIMPQIIKYTQEKSNVKKFYQGSDVNDPTNQLAAVAQYLARLGITTTAATAMMVAGDPRSQERIKHQVDTMSGAKGIDAVDEEARKTYGRSVQEVKASLGNLAILVGNTLLPTLQKVLNVVGDIVRGFSEFAKNNPLTLQLMTVAAAATAVVMAFKGFTSVFGVVGNLSSAIRNLATGFGSVNAKTQESTAAHIANLAATVRSADATRVFTNLKLQEAQAHVNAMSGMQRLTAVQNVLIPAQRAASTATQEHVVASKALSAAQSAASVSSRVLSGAVGLLGGPLGLIGIALTLGALAWDKWGDAAGNAARKAEDAARRGKAALAGMSTIEDKKRNAADIAEKEAELEKYQAKVSSDANFKPLVVERKKQLEVLRAEQSQIQANLDRQKADNDAVAAQLLARSKNVGPKLNGADLYSEEERIAKGALRGARNKGGDTQTGITASDQAVINAANDPGRPKRQFEDLFLQSLANLQGRETIDKLKLDTIMTGDDSYRAQAEAAFKEHWLGGQFDKGHDPSKRLFKKNNKGSNSIDNLDMDGSYKDDAGVTHTVKEWLDAYEAGKKLEGQIKAVSFAKARAKAATLDATDAEDRLKNGLLKESDAMRALKREFDRQEANGDGGAGYEKNKAEALLGRARLDSVLMTEALKQKSQSIQNTLAPDDNDIKVKKNIEENLKVEREYQSNVASLNEQIENYKKAGYDKDSEDYARAIRDKENLEKAHLEWTKEAANLQADMLKTPLQKLVKEWENTRKQVDQLSANWGRGFLNTFATQLIKGRADWRGFLSGMAEDVLKMQLDKTMGRAVEGVFDGLSSWLKGVSASDKSATPGVNGAATAAAGGIGGLLDKTAGGLRDFWNSITGAGKATEGLGNAAVDTALKTGSEIAGMSSRMMAEQNATTSLISLANAASAAATAMGGSASSGVGSGLGGLFGSLFGGGAGATNTGSIMNPQSGWDYQMSQMASPIQFAKGGIMTSMGPLPLNMYAGGGVVNSPQVAIFGEAGPEAYVPLPDGRSIPVTMKGGDNGGPATNITVNVVNQSGTPVQAKQQGQPRIDGKQIVLDIVLGAVTQPGPFRDGMKGALA